MSLSKDQVIWVPPHQEGEFSTRVRLGITLSHCPCVASFDFRRLQGWTSLYVNEPGEVLAWCTHQPSSLTWRIKQVLRWHQGAVQILLFKGIRYTSFGGSFPTFWHRIYAFDQATYYLQVICRNIAWRMTHLNVPLALIFVITEDFLPSVVTYRSDSGGERVRLGYHVLRHLKYSLSPLQL